MNSRSELLGRTLEAFPKDLLQEYFETEGKKEDAINSIIGQFSEKDIKNFICEFFNYLHLTINVFEIGKRIPSTITRLMDGECLSFKSTSRTKEWIYLHKVFVQYYDTRKSETDIMEFLIPVRIFNRGKKLTVYQNTFQRNINSYFEYNIFLERTRDTGVIDNIKHNYKRSIFNLDLNKGIKYLWQNDLIDAMVVRGRYSKSIRQDRMDENFLYKACYPERWEELMKTPIQQTKFKSLGPGISLDHFDCNPSTGSIGVTYHPKSDTEIPELVNLILRKNK